jgi:hypothetical protein
MRSNTQCPGKAVGIFFTACPRHRIFDEPPSGRRKAAHRSRLSAVGSANHAWMLAIGGKLASQDGVPEGGSAGKVVVGLAEFAGDEK